MKRWLTFPLFLLLFLCLAGAARGAEDDTRRYIRMEEVEIIGVVEHPEITYIIPKTRIRFDRIPLERSFSSEATRPVSPDIIGDEIRVKQLLNGQPTR